MIRYSYIYFQDMTPSIELKVKEAFAEDVGKGLARLGPDDIHSINAVLGDMIEISAERVTVARITGTLSNRMEGIVQIDGTTRENASFILGGIVKAGKIPRTTALSVILTPINFSHVLPDERELEQFAKVLQGMAVIVGDKINMPFLAGKERFFLIEATSPRAGSSLIKKRNLS